MSENFDVQLTGSTEGRSRVTFYGRYSSPKQKKASIADQFRNCREASQEKGWVVAENCIRADEEKSGTTLFGRDGIQELIAMVKQVPRPWDILAIDETSRLGRCMADVFKMMDIFDHYGVRVYFVTDDLMSGTEWFRDVFTQKARADEQFSKTHGKRVRRGRIGRFDAGFNPGGGCYGYRNEKVFDPTKKGDHGEPGILGMKQVIDAEEQTIVLRIFTSYADLGMTDLGIACMLNDEHIPPPQLTRKEEKPSWSKHAIQTILTNHRYRGHVVYGRTLEKRDPETGIKERTVRPVAEWRTREDAELRIVSEDLFTRVQERRQARSHKIGVHQLGGMSHAIRVYLFSGLLKCGSCGNNMTIRTTNPPRYGCADHQYRLGCRNRASIKQEDLERALMNVLTAQIRRSDLREELVEMIFDDLSKNRSELQSAEASAEQQRKQLEDNRSVLIGDKKNLLKAIRESGGIRSLYEELAEVEARIDRIGEILTASDQVPEKEVTIDEVRQFVNERLRTLDEFLLSTPEVLRNDFQKRISNIVLTPTVDDRGPVYKVTGDVDLFTLPEGVEQTKQVHLLGLRYTLPISCEVVCYQNRQRWSEPTEEAAVFENTNPDEFSPVPGVVVTAAKDNSAVTELASTVPHDLMMTEELAGSPDASSADTDSDWVSFNAGWLTTAASAQDASSAAS